MVSPFHPTVPRGVLVDLDVEPVLLHVGERASSRIHSTRPSVFCLDAVVKSHASWSSERVNPAVSNTGNTSSLEVGTPTDHVGLFAVHAIP